MIVRSMRKLRLNRERAVMMTPKVRISVSPYQKKKTRNSKDQTPKKEIVKKIVRTKYLDDK